MSGTVIDLEGVSLCYRLARHRIPSFKEYAIHWLRGALEYEELWALKDVSLSVGRGESVGVVGRNGAGKSTLLKVISRVLRPVGGRVSVTGTIAPLLELGTGFDMELTGHENIYLNALLLGHTRREVDQVLDSVIDFSGLERFIHSPIRHYSTGMLSRLGFSIATAWVPDVLILDEILVVGDASFQRRCFDRLERFRAAGTALLTVSHQAAAIREQCDRCLWLEEGELRGDGPVDEILDLYGELIEARQHRAGPAPGPAVV